MPGIRCALVRGGTSKGALFLAGDLPADRADRDDLLLRVMGSPDPRQIDGIGGAHPLTSKVGVVSRSRDGAADVDYLFLQVAVDEPLVSDAQTCGNILAAVGPFAVERGLVPAREGNTDVRVRMVNTGALATLRVQTPGGVVTYDGDARVPGVPGSAAPVEVVVEPSDAPLLPTGHLLDTLEGLEVTLIDNGMPSVLVRAVDLGVSGTEAPAELEADAGLTSRVAALRRTALPAFGLPGDPAATTVPKIVLLAPPADGGTVLTRSFIPTRVHEAVGVLGAASVAAGVVLPGTVAHDLAAPLDGGGRVRVEHPTGSLDLEVAVEPGEPGESPAVSRTSVVRTARLLFDGLVFPGPPR